MATTTTTTTATADERNELDKISQQEAKLISSLHGGKHKPKAQQERKPERVQAKKKKEKEPNPKYLAQLIEAVKSGSHVQGVTAKSRSREDDCEAMDDSEQCYRPPRPSRPATGKTQWFGGSAKSKMKLAVIPKKYEMEPALGLAQRRQKLDAAATRFRPAKREEEEEEDELLVDEDRETLRSAKMSRRSEDKPKAVAFEEALGFPTPGDDQQSDASTKKSGGKAKHKHKQKQKHQQQPAAVDSPQDPNADAGDWTNVSGM